MNANQRRLAAANAKRLRSTIVRVGDQPYSFLPQVRQPRLASTTVDLWCQLGGSLGPATGSWPSITATTTTADVYSGSGTSLTLVTSGATIYNRRNVTWAASKTTFVVPSGSGYAIVDQDC